MANLGTPLGLGFWPTATGVFGLTVQNASHAQSTSSPSLTQANTLIVASAAHGQSAQVPEPVSGDWLEPQNVQVAQTVDAAVLEVLFLLALQDAAHGVVSASPLLVQLGTLVVASPTHSVSSTSPTLDVTSDTTLTLANAAHNQAVSSPTLTQLGILAVDDTTHAQTVDGVSLLAPVTPKDTGVISSHTVLTVQSSTIQSSVLGTSSKTTVVSI